MILKINIKNKINKNKKIIWIKIWKNKMIKILKINNKKLKINNKIKELNNWSRIKNKF